MDEKQCIELLKKHAPSEKYFEKVLAHSKAVQKVGLRIAEEIVANGHHVDIKFLIGACLLHDIGRFKIGKDGENLIQHGILGAEILRKEGLDERYALVCERHIGSGIDEQDIEEQNFDLPKKDYNPKSIEEKIICYADSLIYRTKEITIHQVYERYKEFGERLVEKTKKLHEEIEKLRGK
jgi:uncharacterized protein